MEQTLDAGLTVDASVHDDSIDVNFRGEGSLKDKSVTADENHIKNFPPSSKRYTNEHTLSRTTHSRVIIDLAAFRARAPGGIRVRPHKLLSGCCLLLLAPLACPAFGAQSVADAAREAKGKKQKKVAAQPESAVRKSKVITNEDVPEAKSSVPEPAPSKATGAGAIASLSPKPSPDQSGFLHGPDAAHVDFKITSPTIKRPALAETLWSVEKTSDHLECIALKTVITGPCNYRRENDGGVDLTSGTAETDNKQVSFVPYPSDCPGTYTIALRASVAGRILGSGSDTVTVD